MTVFSSPSRSALRQYRRPRNSPGGRDTSSRFCKETQLSRIPYISGLPARLRALDSLRRVPLTLHYRRVALCTHKPTVFLLLRSNFPPSVKPLLTRTRRVYVETSQSAGDVAHERALFHPLHPPGPCAYRLISILMFHCAELSFHTIALM